MVCVLEDAPVTSENNAAHERQVFKGNVGEVGRLQRRLCKIKVLPAIHAVLGVYGECSKQKQKGYAKEGGSLHGKLQKGA